MVHYIRFLRTPQVDEEARKLFNISAVATVTTDLGDAFLANDLELVVRLVDATQFNEVICSKAVLWSNGLRAVKLSLSCNGKFSSRLVRLHITTQDTMSAVSNNILPAVLDVWSENFHLKGGSRTEAIVERALLLPGKCLVRQWEETGDSIARHIWDASLGFLMLFRDIFAKAPTINLPVLRQQLRNSPSTRLRVLEVGAGCGLVGIALSQLRKSEVLLTDLEEAQDVLQSNVNIAKPLAGSSVQRQVLGWGPSIDALSEPRFDLVLVSDCIYNPDSSLLLVETLVQISNHNSKVLILVGFKRRHEADDIFFDRMKAAGFQVGETYNIPLPHTSTDYDIDEPQVEFFVYNARTTL